MGRTNNPEQPALSVEIKPPTNLMAEIENVSSFVNHLLEAQSMTSESHVTVERDGAILTVAEVVFKEETYHVVLTEEDDQTELSVKSSLYPELSITLPLPTFLGMREAKKVSRDDLC